MSEQFEPTEHARVRAGQGNIAPLLIEVDTYTKRLAAALEAERAAHAATRAEVERLAEQSQNLRHDVERTIRRREEAERETATERAGRERAASECAAMREALEFYAKQQPNGARARDALATDAGAALLERHRAEVERLTDLRDSAAHRAIKERDAARAEVAVAREEFTRACGTLGGRVEKELAERTAGLTKATADRDTEKARADREAKRADENAEECERYEQEIDEWLPRYVEDVAGGGEGEASELDRIEYAGAELKQLRAERDALKDDLEDERARHSLACAALDEVKAERDAARSEAFGLRFDRDAWEATARERDAERARAAAAHEKARLAAQSRDDAVKVAQRANDAANLLQQALDMRHKDVETYSGGLRGWRESAEAEARGRQAERTRAEAAEQRAAALVEALRTIAHTTYGDITPGYVAVPRVQIDAALRVLAQIADVGHLRAARAALRAVASDAEFARLRGAPSDPISPDAIEQAVAERTAVDVSAEPPAVTREREAGRLVVVGAEPTKLVVAMKPFHGPVRIVTGEVGRVLDEDSDTYIIEWGCDQGTEHHVLKSDVRLAVSSDAKLPLMPLHWARHVPKAETPEMAHARGVREGRAAALEELRTRLDLQQEPHVRQFWLFGADSDGCNRITFNVFRDAVVRTILDVEQEGAARREAGES